MTESEVRDAFERGDYSRLRIAEVNDHTWVIQTPDNSELAIGTYGWIFIAKPLLRSE